MVMIGVTGMVMVLVMVGVMVIVMVMVWVMLGAGVEHIKECFLRLIIFA